MSARSIFIFGSLFSLLIILPFPTVFYYFFRVVLFALFIFGYFWAKEKVDKKSQPLLFFVAPIGFAVLFNPIFPVYLYQKSIWTIFNLASAYWFFLAADIAKETSKEHEKNADTGDNL